MASIGADSCHFLDIDLPGRRWQLYVTSDYSAARRRCDYLRPPLLSDGPFVAKQVFAAAPAEATAGPGAGFERCCRLSSRGCGRLLLGGPQGLWGDGVARARLLAGPGLRE